LIPNRKDKLAVRITRRVEGGKGKIKTIIFAFKV